MNDDLNIPIEEFSTNTEDLTQLSPINDIDANIAITTDDYDPISSISEIDNNTTFKGKEEPTIESIDRVTICICCGYSYGNDH